MKAISEYLSAKVKVSNMSHGIDDINKLLSQYENIEMTQSKDNDTFNEITYTYEYSEHMFNLFKDYYHNIGGSKLNQELHRYTSFDKTLEVQVNRIEANSGNAYCFEVIRYLKNERRREIFINCINYIGKYAGDRKIIMILKTNSNLDLYENSYILLKYVFEQMS